MSEYYIGEISPADRRAVQMAEALLTEEGIRLDPNLDYTCALYDEEDQMAATGSCFRKTLRCFAVSHKYQGEGLLNRVVTHLIEYQADRGNFHLYLYTKPDTALFFASLGFHEIARVPGKLVFMENRRDGFSQYLKNLSSTKRSGKSVAVVMNANPFTLGHQYLLETASARCDTLHVFLVSEDLSLFPFPVRYRLVKEGTAHLPNVVLHECGDYMISSATFPTYFLKDAEDAIRGQARLDIEIFKQAAAALGITERWVGEEPKSLVTGIYNEIMKESLPQAGINCVVLPRKKCQDAAISASTVRRSLKEGDFASLSAMVPATTLAYLQSPEAAPVLERIRRSDEVEHY